MVLRRKDALLPVALRLVALLLLLQEPRTQYATLGQMPRSSIRSGTSKKWSGS